MQELRDGVAIKSPRYWHAVAHVILAWVEISLGINQDGTQPTQSRFRAEFLPSDFRCGLQGLSQLAEAITMVTIANLENLKIPPAPPSTGTECLCKFACSLLHLQFLALVHLFILMGQICLLRENSPLFPWPGNLHWHINNNDLIYKSYIHRVDPNKKLRTGDSCWYC